MRNLILLAFVFALLLGTGVVAAQDDEDTSAPTVTTEDTTDLDLPPWADQLAFGGVALSTAVWAATELTKRALGLFNLYKDGWGRVIVVLWTIAFVVAALAGEMFQASGVVAERVEWAYQVMLLLLTLLGAPIVHQVAKISGLTSAE